MKKFLSLLIGLNFLCMPVFAYTLDTSVDDEIRKNYNPNKLEEDMGLPELPKIIQEKPIQSQEISKTQVQKQIKQQIKTTPTAVLTTIKKGTKIRVRSTKDISDSMKSGTKTQFISLYPVSTTYFTIPAGTIFYGEIINSHKPQFTGNGGLIQIEINSVRINSETSEFSARITKANRKKIFFNNIKGKRTYMKSMIKSTTPGYNYFKKMWKLSCNLCKDKGTIILSPFSFLLGTFVYGTNVIASPVVAVFSKGKSIQIPANSSFEIKLNDDVQVYK